MDRREHPAVSTGVPLTQAPIPSWIRIRVTEGDKHALYQRNAPAVADGLYLVPKVIE